LSQSPVLLLYNTLARRRQKQTSKQASLTMLFSSLIHNNNKNGVRTVSGYSDSSDSALITLGDCDENHDKKHPTPATIMTRNNAEFVILTESKDDHSTATSSSRSSSSSSSDDRDDDAASPEDNSKSDASSPQEMHTNDKDTAAPVTVAIASMTNSSNLSMEGEPKPNDRLRRHKSYMIPSSRNSQKNDGSEIENKPTTLVDLVRQRSGTEIKKKPKTILKKTKNTFGSNHNDAATKSVRFATNAQNNSVWCIIKHLDKADHEGYLWWTEEELDIRYDQDREIAEVVHQTYHGVLLDAFESCKESGTKAQDVQLEFEPMAMCAMARGLEHQVYAGLDEMRARHSRRVLGFQKMVTDKMADSDDKHSCGLNDAERRLLRIQSLKASRQCQMVAIKMAEFDRLFAAML